MVALESCVRSTHTALITVTNLNRLRPILMAVFDQSLPFGHRLAFPHENLFSVVQTADIVPTIRKNIITVTNTTAAAMDETSTNGNKRNFFTSSPSTDIPTSRIHRAGAC